MLPIDIEDELWKQFAGGFDILEHRTFTTGMPRDKADFQGAVGEITRLYASEADEGYSAIPKKIEDVDAKWRIAIRKTRPLARQGDSMSKWTFGIITNGNRNEWVDELVETIISQNVPEFEIIICGKFETSRVDSRIRYVPFNKRTKLGWICKKKNLIIEHARHQNILILHDRYVLDANWYQEMVKWGNNFEFATCRQEYF